MIDRDEKLREIVLAITDQRAGSFTTESDAIVALELLKALALLLLEDRKNR